MGSPTYTFDLAAAVKALAEGAQIGTFHVTNRGTCSWFEFARKILDYSGMDEYPDRAYHLGQAGAKGAAADEFYDERAKIPENLPVKHCVSGK